MEITRTQANDIFVDLGYKTAPKWNDKEVQRKINNLPAEIKETDTSSLDIKVQPLVETILRKLKNGKSVIVVDGEASEAGAQAAEDVMAADEDKAAKKEKKEKKAPKAEKAKKAAKPKKAPKEKDAFGNYADSDIAKLNACITKTPKSMQQLIKEAGLKGAYYNHINDLITKGFVKKVEKNYILAK